MFFSGDKTFMSFSIGTMMVVAVAMIGSLTVLPAVLSKLGDRVEKGRVPFVHRLRRKDGDSRVWGAILNSCPPPAGRLGRRGDGDPPRPRSAGVDAQHGHDQRRRHLDPRDRAGQAPRGRLPRWQRARTGRDPGRGRHLRAGPAGNRRAGAEGARQRPDEQPDRGRDQRRQDRRRGRHPARRERHRRRVARGPVDPAGRARAADGRKRRRRRVRSRRHDRGRPGLERGHEALRADRLRLRPALRVPPDADLVPLDRGRNEGDRPQPALRGSRVRRPRRGLPVGLGREPARLRVERRHHPVAADVPVRDPVRALDGLPRVHHQPHPRGV